VKRRAYTLAAVSRAAGRVSHDQPGLLQYVGNSADQRARLHRDRPGWCPTRVILNKTPPTNSPGVDPIGPTGGVTGEVLKFVPIIGTGAMVVGVGATPRTAASMQTAHARDVHAVRAGIFPSGGFVIRRGRMAAKPRPRRHKRNATSPPTQPIEHVLTATRSGMRAGHPPAQTHARPHRLAAGPVIAGDRHSGQAGRSR